MSDAVGMAQPHSWSPDWVAITRWPAWPGAEGARGLEARVQEVEQVAFRVGGLAHGGVREHELAKLLIEATGNDGMRGEPGGDGYAWE